MVSLPVRNGQELGAQPLARHKQEEGSGHQRPRNNVSQRETECLVGTVKEHQRAKEERQDAAAGQHAVRGREDVRNEPTPAPSR